MFVQHLPLMHAMISNNRQGALLPLDEYFSSFNNAM